MSDSEPGGSGQVEEVVRSHKIGHWLAKEHLKNIRNGRELDTDNTQTNND